MLMAMVIRHLQEGERLVTAECGGWVRTATTLTDY
jgi:hypothetical protein